MPELTPEMAREIDAYLALPHSGPLGVEHDHWLAAQRAELAKLRQERDDHVKGYDGASRKWARERDLRVALEAQRDAETADELRMADTLRRLLRVALAADALVDDLPSGYDMTRVAVVETMNALQEIRAILAVDPPSGASHPPDRPTKHDDGRSAR